jgi:hypothetical protein
LWRSNALGTGLDRAMRRRGNLRVLADLRSRRGLEGGALAFVLRRATCLRSLSLSPHEQAGVSGVGVGAMIAHSLGISALLCAVREHDSNFHGKEWWPKHEAKSPLGLVNEGRRLSSWHRSRCWFWVPPELLLPPSSTGAHVSGPSSRGVDHASGEMGPGAPATSAGSRLLPIHRKETVSAWMIRSQWCQLHTSELLGDESVRRGDEAALAGRPCG